MATQGPEKVGLYKFSSVVRGFHVYRDIWCPQIGEILLCEQDLDNKHDKNAVSVVRDDVTVGHVPREHAKIFRFFMKRGGQISCQVTGNEPNLGCGLEIPADYLFRGTDKDLKALPTLLNVHHK